MIERKLTKHLLADLAFFPVVCILGPRQSGKTTLVRSLSIPNEKPAMYLDLELEEDMYKLREASTWLPMHANKCIVIDEVQLLPSLFPTLRALVDQQREPARFVLLGSASPELLRGSSESLAGRVAYHELCPFSLTEVPNGADTATFRSHWLRGGFPDAWLAPTDELAFRWLEQFVRTFVERDLARLVGLEVNGAQMYRFVRMLTHLHAQALNLSELSRSMDVSTQTVNKYLDMLESAYVIRRLEPFHTNLGKRLTKMPKIYLRDTGFLHALTRIHTTDELLHHIQYGASWEGYVIEQIYREAGRAFEYFFYRTSGGAEIDLVLITPAQSLICIEIKASNQPAISRGFFEAIGDLKPAKSYVITPGIEQMTRKDGVVLISLYDFLQEEVPKWL